MQFGYIFNKNIKLRHSRDKVNCESREGSLGLSQDDGLVKREG